MKTIRKVRKTWRCPVCKEKTDTFFQAENAHCNKCGRDYSLGVKKDK